MMNLLKQKKITNQYLAGFIDGEAYIGIKKNRFNKKYAPTYIENVSISQLKHNESKFIFDNMRKKWGGCIYAKKVYVTQKSHNPMWVYDLNYGKAYKLLKDIYPYLIIKKRNAENLFKLFQSKGKRGKKLSKSQLLFREMLYKKGKSLNGNKGRNELYKGGAHGSTNESAQVGDSRKRNKNLAPRTV